MQDIIGVDAGCMAITEVAYITINEVEALPLGFGYETLDFVEVTLIAGGKIIQSDDPLVEFEQGFKEVGADEAGDAGDEPSFWADWEFFEELFVAGHCVFLEIIWGCGLWPRWNSAFLGYRRRSDSSALRMYFRS